MLADGYLHPYIDRSLESGPATTHPLPSQRGHSGVSTSTLIRRASMPTDSLQLYHPLSLQSISHTGSGPLSADPYYAPSNQRNVLENGYGGGRSSMLGNYTQQSGGASVATLSQHRHLCHHIANLVMRWETNILPVVTPSPLLDQPICHFD
jgi:hypothetical protein